MHKVNHKFPYKWRLSDGYPANGIEPNGLNVFGTFVCGGGSTMGYKLAGFNHLGGVELTPHYSELYRGNHKPELFYEQDIRPFNKRKDLPKKLFNLDLLDGSPPCASFSVSGAKDKLWGKVKDYEGVKQKTDDLLQHYADTVLLLSPKVFLTENVSGLIKSNAKWYLKEFVKRFDGKYKVQVFSLNAASMGVPQMRQRVFIIGIRKELYRKELNLTFNEPQISFEQATKEFWNMGGDGIERFSIFKQWKEIDYPKENMHHKKRFNLKRPFLNKPCNTLSEKMSITGAASVCHPLQPRKLNKYEASVLQSFPLDYDFLDQNPLSCIGRSVPPVMVAQIAHQIYLQWFKK